MRKDEGFNPRLFYLIIRVDICRKKSLFFLNRGHFDSQNPLNRFLWLK